MALDFKYIPGDHYVICDRCGFKYRRSQCTLDHEGLMVCISKCFEPQHPQEYIKIVPERIVVDDPRPRKEDVFLEPGDVTEDDL